MSEPESVDPNSQTVSSGKAGGELVLAILILLGAGFAVIVAFVWRWVDCSNESYSTCSTQGQAQVWLAAIGLLPAAMMVVDCFRPKGRPMRWLLVTIVVYAVWLPLGASST